MAPEARKFLRTLEVSGADGILHAVSVEIGFSSRARRIRMLVPRTGSVRLIIPERVPETEGLAFFHTQHKWLLHALARRGKTAAKAPPPVADMVEFFCQYPRLSAFGETHVLECGEIPGRPFFVYHRGENPVIFRHRGGERKEGDLLALVRTFAADVIPARVTELAAQAGIVVSRVSVRNQRGRWGSCSGRGTLSLNWRLVLLPPELHDYVIWHELAHRREMNHSERFWEQVAAWDPRCGWHDRALNKEWGWVTDLARNAE